jgi:hypothetical protein
MNWPPTLSLAPPQRRFTTSRRLVLLGLLALLLATSGTAGTQVAHAAGPLAWSSPLTIDHQSPLDNQPSLRAVSCPSSSLCVGVDLLGYAVISTDPGNGATASWSITHIDTGGGQLSGVSCPSASFCVAVDRLGNVVTTDERSDR